MKRALNVILSIILIIVIIIVIYFVHKYSYIENIEISVLNEDNKYMVIEPYRYDVNKIKKYFMLSNTLFDSSKKYKKEIECLYKVNISDHDMICYDGNESNYALYSRRLDSIDDIKEKVKNKNIKAIGDGRYEVKTFKLHKDFAKMLIDLY